MILSQANVTESPKTPPKETSYTYASFRQTPEQTPEHSSLRDPSRRPYMSISLKWGGSFPFPASRAVGASLVSPLLCCSKCRGGGVPGGTGCSDFSLWLAACLQQADHWDSLIPLEDTCQSPQKDPAIASPWHDGTNCTHWKDIWSLPNASSADGASFVPPASRCSKCRGGGVSGGTGCSDFSL